MLLIQQARNIRKMEQFTNYLVINVAKQEKEKPEEFFDTFKRFVQVRTSNQFLPKKKNVTLGYIITEAGLENSWYIHLAVRRVQI